MDHTTIMAAVMEMTEERTNMENRIRKESTQGRPLAILNETSLLAIHFATPEVPSTPVRMKLKRISRMVLLPNPDLNASATDIMPDSPNKMIPKRLGQAMPTVSQP